MYRALVERDSTFDGLFVVGVRTTGIFCRPTCPAKKPLLENVEFFSGPGNVEEAVRAGYRACKRCRPLDVPEAEPAWARDLIASLDADSARVTDRDLQSRGLEPATVRRFFRDRFGMTFHAYQRARRLGLAHDRIAGGEDGLAAAPFEAGFESDSGFRDAFKKMFGAPPSRVSGRAIRATLIPSPIGPMVAAATPEKLCLFEFADRKAILSQTGALSRWFDEPVVPGENDVLRQAGREFEEYLRGERAQFDVPLDLRGTEFQLQVWNALLEIPYSQTRSYEDIAIAIGRPGSQRAVGMSNGMNRIAIIVPCHRVVEKGGKLRGYGGGLWRKKWLLDLERGGSA